MQARLMTTRLRVRCPTSSKSARRHAPPHRFLHKRSGIIRILLWSIFLSPRIGRPKSAKFGPPLANAFGIWPSLTKFDQQHKAMAELDRARPPDARRLLQTCSKQLVPSTFGTSVQRPLWRRVFLECSSDSSPRSLPSPRVCLSVLFVSIGLDDSSP